jgi:hypothetical protein
MYLWLKKRIKKDRPRKISIRSFAARFARRKGEVGTTYFGCFQKDREVKAI